MKVNFREELVTQIHIMMDVAPSYDGLDLFVIWARNQVSELHHNTKPTVDPNELVEKIIDFLNEYASVKVSDIKLMFPYKNTPEVLRAMISRGDAHVDASWNFLLPPEKTK